MFWWYSSIQLWSQEETLTWAVCGWNSVLTFPDLAFNCSWNPINFSSFVASSISYSCHAGISAPFASLLTEMVPFLAMLLSVVSKGCWMITSAAVLRFVNPHFFWWIQQCRSPQTITGLFGSEVCTTVSFRRQKSGFQERKNTSEWKAKNILWVKHGRGNCQFLK